MDYIRRYARDPQTLFLAAVLIGILGLVGALLAVL